jgi:hypothetical protein
MPHTPFVQLGVPPADGQAFVQEPHASGSESKLRHEPLQLIVGNVQVDTHAWLEQN